MGGACRSALGDLLAVVERDDAIGDALHDVHVVLDEEDRQPALVAQAPDQLGDLVRLVGVHPRRRLVEQQQPRPRGQRAGDLEPAPVRVGEDVGGLVPAVAHQALAEERQHVLGERVDLALLAPGARHAQDRLPRHRLRRPYVAALTFSLTVMLRKSRRDWNVRAMPSCVILCGRAARRCSGRRSGCRPRGRVDAGDEVEDRRLAGAVGPDDADDLALAGRRGRALHGVQAAEGQARALQLEQRAPSDDSTRRVPSSPCGRAFIITMRIAPTRIWRVTLGSTASRASQTHAAR